MFLLNPMLDRLSLLVMIYMAEGYSIYLLSGTGGEENRGKGEQEGMRTKLAKLEFELRLWKY